MNGFGDLARRQRAHRHFRDDPVPDDLVDQLLDTATRAPSSENDQPWVFVVIRDPETRRQIGELTRRMWEGGGRAYVEDHIDPRILADIDHSASGGFAEAPVHILVGGDTEGCAPTVVEASVWPAVQNLLLAATDAGLGSALTTITTVFADELRALTHLPERVLPLAVVPLGFPAKQLGPNRRRPVREVAYNETFDHPRA